MSDSSQPHGPPPPSMGFPRQEYWSGLPLPSLILFVESNTKWKHRALASGRKTNLSFPQPTIPTHSRGATPQELQIPCRDMFSTWMGGGRAVPLQATTGWRGARSPHLKTLWDVHTILNFLGGHPGSCWGAEGSQGTHPSPTPVQPSHCPGRALEEVSECKVRGQEDLLQSNYLLKDSISKYSHILRS